MPKKKNVTVSRKPSKRTDREATFGRDLIAGAKQILAHVKGQKVIQRNPDAVKAALRP